MRMAFIGTPIARRRDWRVDAASHYTESQPNAASTVALVTAEQCDKRATCTSPLGARNVKSPPTRRE